MNDTISRSDVEKVRPVAILVRYGLPYEVAVKMGPAEQLSYLIAFGELEGRHWDWNRLAWVDN